MDLSGVRGASVELEARLLTLIGHPALDATSGFVGLRVTATDTTTGATIKQVHHRAYMLE